MGEIENVVDDLPQTYSRRRRQAERHGPDVFTYDTVPSHVRVQVVQSLAEVIGAYTNRYGPIASAPMYDAIVKFIRHEQGVHSLGPNRPSRTTDRELFEWIETEIDIEKWLDGFECCLRMIDSVLRSNLRSRGREWVVDSAISDINARLREAGVGYEYAGGEVLRVDLQFLHRHAVLPALGILSESHFAAANQEFRDAHEAYRNGELEDAITDCNKALESVLKVIGQKRGWPVTDASTASQLIKAAADAGFLPTYLQTATNHLRGLLESSVPTIRNKSGGHGAGTVPRTVPRHLAAFQLHQTAATILFLAEQDAALP